MTESHRRTAGRPRALDLETLLEAAAGMDLSTITMKSLAERLNVGVATIYRYVGDRSSLVRLASARAVHRAAPVDDGQSWQALVHGYALSIHSALSASPSLLAAYLDGHIGGELEVEFVDRFLAAMTRRGFSLQRAVAIHKALGMLAVGAAAAAVHSRADAAARGPLGVVMADTLSAWPVEELRHFRAALPFYIGQGSSPDLAAAIDCLITGIAEP